MLLDIPLEEAIALVGKRGATDTKDLVTALRKRGVEVGPRRVPSHGHPLPETCIVFARWPHSKKSGHWMLQWHGKLYDPAAHWTQTEYIVTSYVPIPLAR